MSWNTVKCEECKHLISAEDAQAIDFVRSFIRITKGKIYYCPAHQKDYDRVYTEFGISNYYKEFEVDKDGKILK